jgi:hypothetical protein
MAAWLANPVFWFGLVNLSMERWRRAAVMGLVAVLLSFCGLVLSRSEHLHLSWGYLAWVASMAFLSLAGCWGFREARRWRS